jgi:Rrf2 family protein
MVYLASVQPGRMVPFREVAERMEVPENFVAKILKTLVSRKMVRSVRGSQGGYCLAKPPREISFLDVIEAVEGPVSVNVCQDRHESCQLSRSCTMYGVWKLGQERMLEVYRSATLDRLAMSDLRLPPAPTQIRPAAS